MRNRFQIPNLHRVLTIAAAAIWPMLTGGTPGRTALGRVLGMSASAALCAFALPRGTAACTLKTLHSFCTESNCGDGETPRNGLLMDKSGDLYGTTEFGGKYGKELVFKLIPNAKKTKYVEHILKNFCAKPDCADGAYPDSELIMDSADNLYGATYNGGAHSAGTVFELSP